MMRISRSCHRLSAPAPQCPARQRYPQSVRLGTSRSHATDPNLVYETFRKILFSDPKTIQRSSGAHLRLRKICYHPPSADAPLLQDVDMDLDSHQMGLIYGKSGTGKTTLLQVITGLTQPTSGTVSVSKDPTSLGTHP